MVLPEEDSRDGPWVRVPREFTEGLEMGVDLWPAHGAGSSKAPGVFSLKDGSDCVSQCLFVPSAALLGGRGPTGHAVGSRSTGWTPIPTHRVPAMGKEEYSLVLQDPP